MLHLYDVTMICILKNKLFAVWHYVSYHSDQFGFLDAYLEIVYVIKTNFTIKLCLEFTSYHFPYTLGYMTKNAEKHMYT